MSEKQKTKRDNLHILLLFMLATGLLTFSVILSNMRPLEVQKIATTFIVGKNVGFDLNSTALTFGKVPAGNSASREITLENTHDFPIRIHVKISRDIADYVTSPPEYYVPQGRSVTIPFSLRIPQSLPDGEYSGIVSFEIRKA